MKISIKYNVDDMQTVAYTRQIYILLFLNFLEHSEKVFFILWLAESGDTEHEDTGLYHVLRWEAQSCSRPGEEAMNTGLKHQFSPMGSWKSWSRQDGQSCRGTGTRHCLKLVKCEHHHK